MHNVEQSDTPRQENTDGERRQNEAQSSDDGEGEKEVVMDRVYFTREKVDWFIAHNRQEREKREREERERAERERREQIEKDRAKLRTFLRGMGHDTDVIHALVEKYSSVDVEDMNISVEILKDPAQAEVVSQRHESLYKARKIVRAIELAAQGEYDVLNELRGDILGYGGMILPLPVEEVRERIASDDWVITQSLTQTPSGFRAVADCQILLAKDHEHAVPPLLFLDEKTDSTVDECAPHILEEVRRSPAIAACIQDLTTERGYTSHRFAGNARDTAFKHIIEEINPHRKYPIKYVFGEVFRIRGIEYPDGKRILLKDLQEGALYNVASLLKTINSKRWAAIWLGQRNSGDVPVTMSSKTSDPSQRDQCTLITGWNIIAHDLSKHAS